MANNTNGLDDTKQYIFTGEGLAALAANTLSTIGTPQTGDGANPLTIYVADAQLGSEIIPAAARRPSQDNLRYVKILKGDGTQCFLETGSDIKFLSGNTTTTTITGTTNPSTLANGSFRAKVDGLYYDVPVYNLNKITVDNATNADNATHADSADNATTASKLANTTKIGDTNQPVYFTANGVPAAISYTIAKSVPSNAVFTDTATAADDILDGSNTGTQIKYAPYSTQQSKLSFDTSSTAPTRSDRLNLNGYFYATRVYNAVFNDYAEYRTTINATPGHVVIDQDDGSLVCTIARLQPGAQVISDTYGTCMGQTFQANTPIAVAGRVLVYTYQPRENYHAGMAVCSAPNGTVDIMTREEIRDYPDCIVGIVSEIPEYETWGTNNVKVDGRIWVRIK